MMAAAALAAVALGSLAVCCCAGTDSEAAPSYKYWDRSDGKAEYKRGDFSGQDDPRQAGDGELVAAIMTPKFRWSQDPRQVCPGQGQCCPPRALLSGARRRFSSPCA